MSGIRIKPLRQSRSYYLLIPKDLARYFGIDEESEASLSVTDRGDGKVSIAYIFEVNKVE